eukprot:6888934-Karenia_brevis.AAC.1
MPILMCIDQSVRSSTTSDGTVRVLHCVTGDGVNTNSNALKRLLFHMKDATARLRVKYFLLSWVCASHISNLAVAVAICGEREEQPSTKKGICAACSRFFKYLASDYFEEFSASLRHFISRFRFTQEYNPGALQQHRKRSEQLQLLYGSDVLPADLLRLLNADLSAWEHASDATTNEALIRQELFTVLQKYVLQVEEKPIITPEVFSLGTTCPRRENQKRLLAFKAWLFNSSSNNELRVAALCIRLTLHATSITAKVAKPGDMLTLVRIGKGEVQSKT